ncbi:enolase C-terminal domain-like protein [Cupriavidus basilensis]
MRDDVAHVSAIKRALGDRARVTVDVNQAWNEADAATGIAMLEAAGIDLVEQPVPARAARRAGAAGGALRGAGDGRRSPCAAPRTRWNWRASPARTCSR